MHRQLVLASHASLQRALDCRAPGTPQLQAGAACDHHIQQRAIHPRPPREGARNGVRDARRRMDLRYMAYMRLQAMPSGMALPVLHACAYSFNVERLDSRTHTSL